MLFKMRNILTDPYICSLLRKNVLTNTFLLTLYSNMYYMVGHWLQLVEILRELLAVSVAITKLQ